MCGIYGITEHNPKFIKNFIDICKHRGPDGSSVWHNDSITLGHNLLSIMGEPGNATQPWTTPKGNKLVYNGEISSLFREKNQVKEVGTGLECGISIKDFIDFKEKDVI